jgi:hypothetical protein
MRILASGNVHSLNETHFDAPRSADDWLGKRAGYRSSLALVGPDQPDVNALKCISRKIF